MSHGVLAGGFVWMLIVVIGIGTFSIRFSFIPLLTLIELPPEVETTLGFIPAAVLAALVFPKVIAVDGSLIGAVFAPRFISGASAAIIAWRTENMVATVGVGMAILWGFQLVSG